MRGAGLLVLVCGCWMGAAPATTPVADVEAARATPAEPAAAAPTPVPAGATQPALEGEAIARGRRLYETRGCVACHTIDGSSRVGPSWKGMWGRTETLSAPRAPTLVVDAAYIRRSILDPATEVVAGYPPAMPSFSGQLTEADIGDLIAFVQSLK